MFKACYDIQGKYPDSLEWTMPFFNWPNENTVGELMSDEPNIVCFSVFLWSQLDMNTLAQKIKEQYPKTIIIFGGPDVGHLHYEEYMQQRPWVDYAVYGDGEDAFVKLIDAILESKLSSLELMNIPNLIFRNKQDKAVKTKHEIYKGKMFTEYSHWIHCADEVLRDADYIRSLGFPPTIGWETNRGCPYQCSFCDWSAGLHTKVTKKKYDGFDELDLFSKAGVHIFLKDANFGSFPNDQRYLERMWELGIIHWEPSWAKLNKAKVFGIIDRMMELRGFANVHVSLQSISNTVLENIDRPSIDWKDIKPKILALKEKGEVLFSAETIAGLPGETKDSWDHMMNEFIDVVPYRGLHTFSWTVLPHSPGANIEYQTKMKLDVRKTRLLYEDIVYNKNNVSEEELAHTSRSYLLDLVWGSYSNGVDEHLYSLITAGILYRLQKRFQDKDAIRKVFNGLKPKMWARAQKDAEKFRQHYDTYGVMPYYAYHGNMLYNYNKAWMEEFSIDLLLKGEQLLTKP